MKKEKLTLEYPLNRAAEQLLWVMIGTPLGLAQWFSDGVTVEDDRYTFSWDDHDQTARLLTMKEGKNLRFQWVDDADTDAYFEMEIIRQDISGNVGILVTELADPDEFDDLTLLWNHHIDNLCRKVGIG